MKISDIDFLDLIVVTLVIFAYIWSLIITHYLLTPQTWETIPVMQLV